MVGVSAPGRWILAIASRKAVMRACGSFLAASMMSDAISRSATNVAAAAATKIAAMRLS